MRLSCVAGRHEAGPRRVRNQGLEFGRCWICGSELVRSRAAWRTVPKGFRVVWRRGPPVPAEAVDAAQLLFNLPASGRGLAPKAGPERRKSRAAAAAELLALGAHCLAWAVADRVRAWVRAFTAPTRTAHPVLCLPAG